MATYAIAEDPARGSGCGEGPMISIRGSGGKKENSYEIFKEV
jgi:hypothetical protein